MSGCFVAMEGLDGSGGTTQVQRLCEALGAHATAEPSGGPVGQLIRASLRGEEPVADGVLPLLFAADRADHLEREILPRLAAGEIVVTDRYYASSLAYQSLVSPLAEVARLKVEYPDRVHLLMGNHEMSELTGQEILKGGVCLNILFRQALINKYGEEHADGIRTAMLKFFRSWPLAIRTENRIFICHSTPPAKHIRHYSTRWFRQDTESLWTERNRKMLYLLLWSREYDPKAAKQFAGRVDADVLLVGHKSCPKGWDVPNDTHIIIDCKDHRAHLISFDLTLPYTHEELSQRLERLHPVGTTI